MRRAQGCFRRDQKPSHRKGCSTRVDSSGKEFVQEELAGAKFSKISGYIARLAIGELVTGCGQNQNSAAGQKTCEVGGEAIGAASVW